MAEIYDNGYTLSIQPWKQIDGNDRKKLNLSDITIIEIISYH